MDCFSTTQNISFLVLYLFSISLPRITSNDSDNHTNKHKTDTTSHCTLRWIPIPAKQLSHDMELDTICDYNYQYFYSANNVLETSIFIFRWIFRKRIWHICLFGFHSKILWAFFTSWSGWPISNRHSPPNTSDVNGHGFESHRWQWVSGLLFSEGIPVL